MFRFVKKLKAIKNDLNRGQNRPFDMFRKNSNRIQRKLIMLRPDSLLIRKVTDSIIGFTDLLSKGKKCCFFTKNIRGVQRGKNGQLMVTGTPTIFSDGQIRNERNSSFLRLKMMSAIGQRTNPLFNRNSLMIIVLGLNQQFLTLE